MIYGIAIVFLALWMVGCVRLVWTKPDLTEQEFRTDSYARERDMRQSGYYGTGIVGALNAQDFQDRCMRAKGYYKVPADQVQRIYNR